MSEKHILTKKLKEADFYALQTAKEKFVSKATYGKDPIFFNPFFGKDALIWDSYNECSIAKKN